MSYVSISSFLCLIFSTVLGNFAVGDFAMENFAVENFAVGKFRRKETSP